MDTGINLSQEQLQKLSINQIQSLHILSLSAESLHDLLQKESEENPFMDYSPVTMLMYGKEASNRKQEIDRQHYTIPNQRPKDKHCGKI